MPTVTVCPYCRKKCLKCHRDVGNKGHTPFACNDCFKQLGTKCGVCGGNKSGPGTAGAVGTGSVCDKCFKVGACFSCGNRI